MTKLKFEITWEDVQDIAKQRNGQTLSKKVACFLLARIESGVRGWFSDTKGDSICDALQVLMRKTTPPTAMHLPPFGRTPPEPRDHNDAEGVVTMRDLA
jgi:hypothetical protein